ncbi:MAG: hypothetical protein ACRC8A_08835 [Microcoleaceae cyanobacterium]
MKDLAVEFLFSNHLFWRILPRFNAIPYLLCLTLLGSCFGILAAQAQLTPSIEEVVPAIAQTTQSVGFLKDGTYLYGQSPIPNQIGQAYMVFEVIQRQVVGAFYMPNSSFDCFSGTPQGNRLALTIVDSYTQETHPYGIGLHSSAVAASRGSSPDQLIALEGFHQIASLSASDHRILATCKTDLTH